MNRSPKLEAVTRMLNAFPPTSDDFSLLLDTYEQQLAEVSTEAVERAVRRFLDGEVDGQNKKFAPTMPEFMGEARDCQRYVDLLNQARVAPRIAYQPMPDPSGHLPPFLRLKAKKEAEYAGREILFTDVNFDQWRRLSASREVPEGAVWVACLGTVYGPAKNATARAA